MKTEEQIRSRLKQLNSNKAMAKLKGFEKAYIINCKVIKLFKWILDEEEVKVKDKRIRKGDYKK